MYVCVQRERERQRDRDRERVSEREREWVRLTDRDTGIPYFMIAWFINFILSDTKIVMSIQ